MTEKEPSPVNPGAVLNWRWRWADWLEPGDALATQELVLCPELSQIGGLTQVDGVVTARLSVSSAAQLGKVLPVVCKITTVLGDVDQRTGYLLVKKL